MMYCKAKQLIPKPAASTFLWNCGWFRKIEGRDFDKILWRDISRLLLHRMRAAHPAREACISPIVCLKTWLCLLCLSLLCLTTYRLVCSTVPFSALLYSIQLCPDDFSVLLCFTLTFSPNKTLPHSLYCQWQKVLCPEMRVGWKRSQISKTVQNRPFWASYFWCQGTTTYLPCSL